MKNETQFRLIGWDRPLSAGGVIGRLEPDTWYTRKKVADLLGRSKSPTLVKLLADLVAARLLDFTFIPLPNSVDMYVYRLSETGIEASKFNNLPNMSITDILIVLDIPF